MALARPCEDLIRQSGLVVRADQRERARGREGQVEERFVPLALGNLLRRPPCPDRLSDPVERLAAAAMAGNEVVPHGNDASGVPAGRLHVDEFDASRSGAEPAAQSLLARREDGDEHWLVALDRACHERQDGGTKSCSPA